MPKNTGAEVESVPIVEESSPEGMSPESMTRALEDCFLQAVKTHVKDKDLPMSGNTFYAQHMRPCRRACTNIDVKASSCKKLGVFLSHLEERGWLALKKNTADPV